MTMTVADDQATRDLDELRVLTKMIRKHQDAIASLADRRRAAILALREPVPRATYHKIAEAMDVTEQTVYRILREGPRKPADTPLAS